MITRSKIIHLLWLAMLLMLVGCNGRLSLIKDAIRFYNSTVSFPDKMLCIENGDTATVAIQLLSKPLFVDYYSPDECSDCALNTMREKLRMANYSKDNGLFDYMVILAPPEHERESVVEKAMDMTLPLCIYIDVSLFFELENVIPSNPVLHSFLLDANHTPIYSGNPLHDYKHRVEFEERLK
jgi:hypothetical protein